MTLAAVFLLSFSSLYFELVLTRFFSLSQGSHLAFLVIGIAMLGSAAGGTARSQSSRGASAPGRMQGEARGHSRSFAAGFLCLSMQVSMLGSFLGARFVPLEYLRLPVDGSQFIYLVLDLVLLSLPFFVCGYATCAAYDDEPERSGAISLASMAGSGVGALAPLFLFPPLGEGRSLVLVCACLLAPAIVPVRRHGEPGGHRFRPLPFLSALSALGCVALFASGVSLALPLSPYSSLAQMRNLPATRSSEIGFDIRGRLDLVESPSFRFAPGTSLVFGAPLPPAAALLTDGDCVQAIYDLSSAAACDFARSTVSALGWLLAPRSPSALIVQRNGGTAAARAMAFGSRETIVLVEHPAAAAAMRSRGPAGIEYVAANPRSYLAMDRRSYDLIEVEDWGAALPGTESLAICCHFTTDAFRAYWRHLSAAGVLVVPRRLLLPPGDILRLFSSAARALEEEGIEESERRMAVARGWDACALLVSRSPIEGGRLSLLRESARALGFDLDWFPGIESGDVNRFNRFERPYHYEALRDLVSDPDFARKYPLDVAAQDDDRPFPSKLLKWTRIAAFYAAAGERPYALALSGEIAALASLGAATLVSIPLVLAPVLARRKGKRGGAWTILFFAASGAGFVFAELSFLDGFALLWNSPSLCLAIVLSAMLAFSGAGGIASRGLGPRGFRVVLLLAAAAIAAAAFLLRPLAAVALGLGPAWQVACAFGFIAAPSFLLGVSFPVAMRLMPPDGARGLCWAVNGAASVLASILSAPIAASLGIRALALCAALAYCIAVTAAGPALRLGGDR